MNRNLRVLKRNFSKQAWKYQAVGAQWSDQFSQEGPTGEAVDSGAAFKRAPRRVMRIKRPKAAKIPSVKLMEMNREELEQIEVHEPPVDNMKEEANAIVPASGTEMTPVENTELATRPFDETDPHRPQRRVFRTYQNFDKLHYPAASQSDITPSHVYDHYKDHQLAPYENQIALPRMDFASDGKRHAQILFSWHNRGLSMKFRSSPSMNVGAGFWARKARDRYNWAGDPLATTFDMVLDEPTNPLLAAPHSQWESLPLADETLPPDQLREETGTTTVDVDGVEMKVTPNTEVDVFPVAVHPTPGKYSKQYGMPIQKTIGPIQWAEEEWVTEKLHRAEKHLHLKHDPSKPGQQMKILCIGDTLTLGMAYGSDAGNAYRGKNPLHEENEDLEVREHPYAMRLHELMNADIEVMGVYRDTVHEMRDRLWRKLTEKHEAGDQYDLVIIWGGVYDLFSPAVEASEVAQNLKRMHHIAHMHGCKTVGLTISQFGKQYKHILGPGVLTVNGELEGFARSKRKDMLVVDLFKMIPFRSNPNTSTGQATWLGKLGPGYFSGSLEMTPFGYDRVGELIFKELKHRPGFLQRSISSRFYDHPISTPNPDDWNALAELNGHYSKHASLRATLATPDLYGSTYATRHSFLKEPTDTYADIPLNEDYEKRVEDAIDRSIQSCLPTWKQKKHRKHLELENRQSMLSRR